MTTITTLARDLDLSVGAISRIINGKGRFSADTRARVLERARMLGFRPNASARSTRTQRFDTLTLLTITPTWKGVLYLPVLNGAIEAAAGRGKRLIVASCTDESLRALADQPDALRSRMCDGFLVNYHLPPPPEIRAAIAATGAPVVWLNQRLDAACVHPDDLSAARRLAETLIAQGHRRIAYLDTSHPLLLDGTAHYSVIDRRMGVAGTCSAAGRPARIHAPEQVLREFDEHLAFTRALFAGPERPDAVIAYTAADALRIRLVAAELGLAVPRDLSLVMFHDHDWLDGMPLDAMIIPMAEMGARAVDLLLAAIGERNAPIPAVAVPFVASLGRSSQARN